MHIVIAGGAGFIGTKLTEACLAKGYSVTVLDRSAPRLTHTALQSHVLDLVHDAIDPAWVSGADAVVNLAGVPIFGRFTKQYKKVVFDSRILSTRALVTAITTAPLQPKAFICASAVGYYGDTHGTTAKEDYPAGSDFLSHVCEEWEQAAKQAESLGLRVVTIRTANVIGPGGLLFTLVPLFRKWIGGYFGAGTQHMPWVYWEDILGIYLHAIENPLSGPYNAAAGNPTQRELMQAVQHAVKAPVCWRIPVVAARLLYLGFADALVSDISVDTTKLTASGYVWKETDLMQAITRSIS